MKKKIVVFSGAGLDRESGILTFRDCKDGLWNNHKIDEVATPEGWQKNPQKVLDFYNERRSELPNVEPNKAHKSLVELEDLFDVIHLTQNVSDLLERAGASNVYHLHGKLTEAINDVGNKMKNRFDRKYVTEIGHKEINLGDVCKTSNKQLRPNIVWFGEMPFHVPRGYQALENADILIVIGTSLQIGYTLEMLQAVKKGCRIIYIDPEPMNYLSNYGMKVEYIREMAEKGVSEFVDELIESENENNDN